MGNLIFLSPVLARSYEDGIGLDEADTLQTELETLLAAVAKRMRQLEVEINTLNNWQENKVPSPVPSVGKPEKTKGKSVSRMN